MEKYPQNQSTNPEKFDIKKASKKALYGLAIIAMLSPMVGCSDTAASSETGPSTTVEENNDNVRVPKEASEFVGTYTERYGSKENAVATYFAEQELEKKFRGGIISQSFIDAYVMQDGLTPGVNGWNYETQKGIIYGFELYQVPSELNIMERSDAVEIFNNYTAPMLDNFINMSIKNPGEDTEAIIKNEFKNYCAAAAFDSCNGPTDFFNMSDNLINSLDAYASKFGSNVNIEIMPAGQDSKEKNKTSFDQNAHIGSEYEEETVTIHEFEATPNICVKIDTFDANGEKVTTYETLSLNLRMLQEMNNNYLFLGS